MHSLNKNIKRKLKSSDVIRENYRRLRKISLHIAHGRFFQAIRLANHYNPFYRLLLLSPYRLNRMQKKHLFNELETVFKYRFDPLKPFNVVLIMRDGDSFPKSSAFIRLLAPLTHPSISDKVNIALASGRRPKISNVNNSIYVVQRTAFDNLSSSKKFMSKIRRLGARLIVDNDDAFHLLSESHPEYYTQRKRVAAIEYLYNESDMIWVSVNALVPQSNAHKTKVVENCLDERIWQRKARKKEPVAKHKINMVYMGTATHDADFRMILPALDKINDKYPSSFSLTTVGVSPDMPERTWINQINPPRFASMYPSFVSWFLKQKAFDLGLSPLVDNEFNRAKSDIKCLDYIAAGILPVVSNVQPYQGKEIADFIIKIDNDPEKWFEKLEEIISAPSKFRNNKTKIIFKAQKYLWAKRSSEVTAKKILHQLESLNEV